MKKKKIKVYANLTKREFIAWIILPKDKSIDLKKAKRISKWAYICLTKADLIKKGYINDKSLPTKVIIKEF